MAVILVRDPLKRLLKIGTNKMAKKQTQIQVFKKIKKKRKGVHSKNKNSTLKTSKNYKKRYKGQGR